MKRSRLKRKPTRRSPEGARAIREFMADHPRCWWCGKLYKWPHHIAGRDGQKLADDRRNLAAMCWWFCHQRKHVPNLVVDGKRLPAITDAQILAAKRRWDPEHYDLEFLRVLDSRFFNVEG
jgi:hypothetical protein